MTLKPTIAIMTALVLATTVVTGCGKKETASSKGSNIIQKSEPQEGDTSAEKNYEVKLDERSKDTMYQYGMDDLSFVDTVTGKKVTIGMSVENLEEVAGTPITVDNNYRIYDGLIVQFNEENKAVALLISGGLFQSESQGTRFMTTRGVGLLTGREDFVKAYGDLYNEGETETDENGEVVIKKLSNAVRYFSVDGNKVEYLGIELTEDMKQKYSGKLYMQDFMFDREANQITTMRVINVDYIGK